MSSETYYSISSSRILIHQAASLLLYQSIFNNEIGRSFLEVLNALHNNEANSLIRQSPSVTCLQSYSYWFKALATKQQSWQDYLIERILLDDNPFSQQVQRVSLENLPESLIEATKHDLQTLQNIYNCSTQQIGEWVQTASQLSSTPIAWNIDNRDRSFLSDSDNWAEALENLAIHYRQKATGIFAEYKAFSWQEKQLVGIPHPDPISLEEIIGYENQKQVLLDNTEYLLAGYSALNVLLYGSRGSGKSSLVKSLLHKYGDHGLRLIEVSKSELKQLPAIVERLRNVPQKFIIFVDDLSFEEDDDTFKALKVVLEGSLTAKATNVLVYATSNRRHLIREFFGDRPRPSDSDEIHAWDTLQEKLSFSDRFGLTLTFEPVNQDDYLNIVINLAKQTGIDLEREELEFRAKQWATRHNGRSGRTAKQFINFLKAQLATSRLQDQ
jgi:hypothetical protein